MENLVVRNIEASPGEKIFGWLKVAEMQDSRSAELPVVLINGENEGPKLYIQAAVDGNELSSIAMLREAIKQVAPENLSGKIIAVVLTNFFGFHANEVWNPLDKNIDITLDSTMIARLYSNITNYLRDAEFLKNMCS